MLLLRFPPPAFLFSRSTWLLPSSSMCNCQANPTTWLLISISSASPSQVPGPTQPHSFLVAISSSSSSHAQCQAQPSHMASCCKLSSWVQGLVQGLQGQAAAAAAIHSVRPNPTTWLLALSFQARFTSQSMASCLSSSPSFVFSLAFKQGFQV